MLQVVFVPTGTTILDKLVVIFSLSRDLALSRSMSQDGGEEPIIASASASRETESVATVPCAM